MDKADSCSTKLAYFQPDLETASPPAREAHWNAGLIAAAKTVFKKSSPFNKLLTKAGIARGDLNSRQTLARAQIIRYVPGSDLAEALEDISALSTTVSTNWQQALYAAGLRPTHSVQIPIGRDRIGLAMNLDKAARALQCASIHTGAAGLDFQINLIKLLDPTAVLTTPDWLIRMERRADRLRLDIKRDLGVSLWISAGEMIPPKTLERLEQRLGRKIRQTYHVPGIGCLGYECPERSGLHVPDGILPEIVDAKTQTSLLPGHFGEYTATLLDPKHPILRLATGDSGLLTHQPCSCGRTSPRFLTPKEGELLFPGFVP